MVQKMLGLFVLALAILPSFALRFEHVHEDEDTDLDMQVDGLHVNGKSHIVAKTCFPVTMQVCMPLANFTGNSTGGGLFPRPTPSDCKNDAFECQQGSYCSATGSDPTSASSYYCYDQSNWENTPVNACSHNCRSSCPYGTCTPCTAAGSHTCYSYASTTANYWG